MTYSIYIKTNRTQKGYAKGEIHKTRDFTNGKTFYSFKFYQTYKFFDTYKELREYVENNYELLNYNVGFGINEYHLPEKENDYFRY